MEQFITQRIRFWWVNQNQTYKQEVEGGYLWSPKRNSGGGRNPFYEFMREVSPGDIVFSFADTRIKAIGVTTDYCFEAPKPAEFCNAGMNWENVGWKVPVHWTLLQNPIRPADHMMDVRPELPSKYSPLQQSGRGNQGVYLTAVPQKLANVLGRLIGPPVNEMIKGQFLQDSLLTTAGRSRSEITEWEDHLEKQVKVAKDISDTQRTDIVSARRGQGIFRKNVLNIEKACRVTGVSRAEHLIASHCKPWRDCEKGHERLDGENGLMLTPSVDHLFDRGFITFENKGQLAISPRANTDSLNRMGIDTSGPINVGAFSEGQKEYLEFHREHVFLEARVSMPSS